MCTENSYAGVFMDLQMPRLGGQGAAERIRQYFVERRDGVIRDGQAQCRGILGRVESSDEPRSSSGTASVWGAPIRVAQQYPMAGSQDSSLSGDVGASLPKIIVFTASCSEDVDDAMAAELFDGMLPKPYTDAELVAALSLIARGEEEDGEEA